MGIFNSKLKLKCDQGKFIISNDANVLHGYLERMYKSINDLKNKNSYEVLEYTEMFKSRKVADNLCITLKNIGYDTFGEYNDILKMFSVSVHYKTSNG